MLGSDDTLPLKSSDDGEVEADQQKMSSTTGRRGQDNSVAEKIETSRTIGDDDQEDEFDERAELRSCIIGQTGNIEIANTSAELHVPQAENEDDEEDEVEDTVQHHQQHIDESHNETCCYDQAAENFQHEADQADDEATSFVPKISSDGTSTGMEEVEAMRHLYSTIARYQRPFQPNSTPANLQDRFLGTLPLLDLITFFELVFKNYEYLAT